MFTLTLSTILICTGAALLGGFTLDILLTQVEQGLVARAKSGRSSLMQYQEKAYGLSRASVLTRGRGRA